MEDYYSRQGFDAILDNWCVCSIRNSEPWIANQFCVSDNTNCPLCNEFIVKRHYHCGYCTKLTKIG